MTQEQIEQAAQEYADKNERYEWQEDGFEEECAFIAGCESRQAEIDELLEALENLVFLHGCEQEGIACGQPTAKQWIDAVDAAEKAIDKAKGESR